MGHTLYNIDLKRDEQNYICFSGWFLSKNPITEGQKKSLVNFIKEEHENIYIKSFDGEGEDLNDYCNDFSYFNLELIGENSLFILDLNYLYEYDKTIDLSDFILCNDNNKVLLFNKDGEISNLET
jgi:hypothetical protein